MTLFRTSKTAKLLEKKLILGLLCTKISKLGYQETLDAT